MVVLKVVWEKNGKKMGKDGKSKSLLVSAVFCFAETAALNSLNGFWFCVPWPPRVVNQHLTLASVDIA